MLSRHGVDPALLTELPPMWVYGEFPFCLGLIADTPYICRYVPYHAASLPTPSFGPSWLPQTRSAYPYDDQFEDEPYPVQPYRLLSCPSTGVGPTHVSYSLQRDSTFQTHLQELTRLCGQGLHVDEHDTRRLIEILAPRAPHEIDALRHAFEASTGQDLTITLCSLYRQKPFSVQCILVGLTMGPICYDVWLLLRVFSWPSTSVLMVDLGKR